MRVRRAKRSPQRPPSTPRPLRAKLLAEPLVPPTAPGGPSGGPLDIEDIELIEWAADAKWRNQCADIVQTVCSMNKATRRAICVTVCKLHGTDLVPGQRRTQDELDALHVQLRDEVSAGGGTIRIADALWMSGARTAASADPKRASLVANVIGAIDAWSEHRAKTRDSVSEAMNALITRVNWDHVQPGAAVAAFRALLGGLPIADVQDVSDAADREREVLASCADEDEERVTPGDLRRSDAWLMVYTTQACERVFCWDFIDEVSDLPRTTRDRVAALARQLDYPEGPGPHPERALLQTRLVKAIIDGGGSQSLADAFVLPPDEWRLRHVPSLPTASQLLRGEEEP